MRVLVSAYACEPGRGSEPGIGWNWVQQIARCQEVWVLTRANNRDPIEKQLAATPLPGAHFVYYDLPRWARFWKTRQRGVHAYYCLWQIGAYFVARKLHRRTRFNLIHHVTFGNYWLPSFLALLPVSFIWGPIGGAETAPSSFWWSYSLRGKLYEFLRNFARFLGERDPFVRMTARRAAMVLATTDQTARRLRALGCRNISVVSQVGLSDDEIKRLGCFPNATVGSFRLLSSGRLLHWKGFELGLRAFAQFQTEFPASEYWLIGDGPERKSLESLARRFGIARKTIFWGEMTRRNALRKLAECDVLLHPSLHDSGGFVSVEAMAAGRPVICLDLGGLALQVTDETGIKMPAVTPKQVVSELAQALQRLARDHSLCARMGRAGRARVDRDFNWKTKGELLANIYGQVLRGQVLPEDRHNPGGNVV